MKRTVLFILGMILLIIIVLSVAIFLISNDRLTFKNCAEFIGGVSALGILVLIFATCSENLGILLKLLRNKFVLSEPKALIFSTFVGQPIVKGQFKNYDAEYGVMAHPGDLRGIRASFDLFYRVKLKGILKVPLHLLSECPIQKYPNINLCFGKWVTIKMSVGDICALKEAISADSGATIRINLQSLVEVAQQIEQGKISF